MRVGPVPPPPPLPIEGLRVQTEGVTERDSETHGATLECWGAMPSTTEGVHRRTRVIDAVVLKQASKQLHKEPSVLIVDVM